MCAMAEKNLKNEKATGERIIILAAKLQRAFLHLIVKYVASWWLSYIDFFFLVSLDGRTECAKSWPHKRKKAEHFQSNRHSSNHRWPMFGSLIYTKLRIVFHFCPAVPDAVSAEHVSIAASNVYWVQWTSAFGIVVRLHSICLNRGWLAVQTCSLSTHGDRALHRRLQICVIILNIRYMRARRSKMKICFFF